VKKFTCMDNKSLYAMVFLDCGREYLTVAPTHLEYCTPLLTGCLLILTGKFPPDGYAWHNVQQSPNKDNFGLILNNKC